MRSLTTYGRVLRTIVSLKASAADLRLLALQQKEPEVKQRLDRAATELEQMVQQLEERRRVMLAEEPSYDEIGVEPQSPVVSKS